MSKKYSKSKSSARRASGGKRQSGSASAGAKRKIHSRAAKKKLAKFKALYVGAKPQAKAPENPTQHHPGKDGPRR